MTTAVLSLGANLGDRRAALASVIERLGDRLIAVSSLYATAPWGVTEQPEFYNAVVLARSWQLGPPDWLSFAKACEAAALRERGRRWGPRTLDVDVIDVDGVRWQTPELELPHPRAAERGFVMLPWAEIDQEAWLPGTGRVAQTAAALPEQERSGCRVVEAASWAARSASGQGRR